ncbi:MAG: RidA family protein [bacterium]|nr:RidA family protein [bacterium]
MRRSTVPSLLVVLLALTVASLAPAAGAERRVIAPPGAKLGDLPFSPGILAGDFLFLSGALGNEPGTLKVPGDAAAQTRRTMDNLGTLLEAAGMDFSRVVSVNVYLADSRHFRAMNEVYVGYFPQAPPARATVEADIAIRDAQLEISMVAARPGLKVRPVTPQGWQSSPAYSWAVEAGDTLYLAGLVSYDAVAGRPVPGNAAQQTERTLNNAGEVLRAAGMDPRDVVSCRVYLSDARDYAAMNEAYGKFFPEAPPARATVRTRLVDPVFKIEIQCLAVRGGERRVVAPAGETPGPRPFSPAVRVGDRLFLSGMVGRKDGSFPPGVAAQTRLVCERLQAVLAAAGMDFTDVVNATVYLSDVRHYAAMNEVYRQCVPAAPPARATVGAPLMSPDALVEIAMTASRSAPASD